MSKDVAPFFQQCLYTDLLRTNRVFNAKADVDEMVGNAGNKIACGIIRAV